MIKIDFYKNEFYEEVKQLLQKTELYYESCDLKENLKCKISRDSQSILIAIDENQIVGCVFISEDGWSGFIWRLCVQESHRKEGIGSMLLKKAEEIIRNRGINEVSIFVDPKNDSLKNWYQKKDYTKDSDWTFMYKRFDAHK